MSRRARATEPEDRRPGRGVEQDHCAHCSSEKASHPKNHDHTSLRRQDLSVRPEAGTLTWKDCDGARLIRGYRRNTNKDQGERKVRKVPPPATAFNTPPNNRRRPEERYHSEK